MSIVLQGDAYTVDYCRVRLLETHRSGNHRRGQSSCNAIDTAVWRSAETQKSPLRPGWGNWFDSNTRYKIIKCWRRGSIAGNDALKGLNPSIEIGLRIRRYFMGQDFMGMFWFWPHRRWSVSTQWIGGNHFNQNFEQLIGKYAYAFAA